MNTPRLSPTDQVLDVGETAFSVFSSPYATQGWRPASVRIQPAKFEKKGNAIPTIAARWNHFALLELLPPEQPAAPEREQDGERPEIGHHPHAPVDELDVRDVVPRPVLLLVLRLKLVDPDDLAVERVRREEREQAGDLESSTSASGPRR